MFTGIIEELGSVRSIEERGENARLVIGAHVVTEGTNHGDSISVNGVCLTALDIHPDSFAADVSRETLLRSTLGRLRPGAPVNLERAVTPATRLGGHIVQGHVDGTGTIVERIPGERWEIVRVSLPAELRRYVVDKGSITVDGISLTVVEAGADSFTVSLIPTTLALTTLGLKQPGDPVNLEVDVLAKYVERLLADGAVRTITGESAA